MLGTLRTPRRLIAATTAAAVLAGAALALGAPPPSTAGEPPPPRLLVTSREWRLELSRTTIDPGNAIVQLWNKGEDAHDLWIRRRQGTKIFKSPETLSGELSEFRAQLRRNSTYKLWCSLPGHEALGMKARIRTNGG